MAKRKSRPHTEGLERDEKIAQNILTAADKISKVQRSSGIPGSYIVCSSQVAKELEKIKNSTQ